ncbi:TlpA family protein disulfide reductase [Paenibacillus sp. TSA_86.1]|uniref:TlpA family protein disulfide reductase n=1 Tax=Paenibacillus sp. TSA_86.1 TaxID=3415649 RepID=UPI004045CFC3
MLITQMVSYSSVIDYKGNKINFSKEKCQLFLFVSLYCNHCVDFLPEITSLRNKIPNIEFVLFCNGDEEEHDGLIEYFNWDFPVVHIETEDATLMYDINTFPYFIFIKENQKVLGESLTKWEKYEHILLEESDKK